MARRWAALSLEPFCRAGRQGVDGQVRRSVRATINYHTRSTYASGVTAGGCSISGSVPATSSGSLATRAGCLGSGPPITSWAGGVAGASSAAWRTGTSTSEFVAAASARSSAARAAWAARRERGDASGAAAGADDDDEPPESLESVLADESVSVSEYPAALRSAADGIGTSDGADDDEPPESSDSYESDSRTAGAPCARSTRAAGQKAKYSI